MVCQATYSHLVRSQTKNTARNLGWIICNLPTTYMHSVEKNISGVGVR